MDDQLSLFLNSLFIYFLTQQPKGQLRSMHEQRETEDKTRQLVLFRQQYYSQCSRINHRIEKIYIPSTWMPLRTWVQESVLVPNTLTDTYKKKRIITCRLGWIFETFNPRKMLYSLSISLTWLRALKFPWIVSSFREHKCTPDRIIHRHGSRYAKERMQCYESKLTF